MSKQPDASAQEIAERVQHVLGYFDGDLADFLAHQGVPSSGASGAWELVKDAQLIALMVWELRNTEIFNEQNHRDAGLLIWRLLTTAQNAMEAHRKSD